jgi:hypothetical protein
MEIIFSRPLIIKRIHLPGLLQECRATCAEKKCLNMGNLEILFFEHNGNKFQASDFSCPIVEITFFNN